MYSLINILPRTKLYNISVAIVCDVSLTSIESDIAAFIALKTLFHHVIITEHYGEISRKNVQSVSFFLPCWEPTGKSVYLLKNKPLFLGNIPFETTVAANNDLLIVFGSATD